MPVPSNQCVMRNLDKIKTSEYNLSGKQERFTSTRHAKLLKKLVKVRTYMSPISSKTWQSAYAAADLIISRAGAGSISEFCLLGKPVILVPSPNAAEDPNKNAMALVNKLCSNLCKDASANAELIDKALQTVTDEKLLKELVITLAN